MKSVTFGWLNPFFLIILLIIFTKFGHAATINVPADYSSIQAALDAAQSGDSVLVAQGTYTENYLNFNGKEVELKSISGAALTIIDGNSLGPVFFIVSGETRNTIIEGFTIQNGNANETHLGGGIYMVGSLPTIKNNIIKNNTAELDGSSGGGIKVSTDSNPLIESNTIINNTSWQKGGGIHVFSASAEIRNNLIKNCQVIGNFQATGGGLGGTFTETLIIDGNTVEGNSTSFAGGGISVFAGNAQITNNIIRNNDGGDFGGGIHIETQESDGNYTFLIRNNTIFNNSANIGGGIHSFMENTSSSVEIKENDIIENESINPLCESASDSGCGFGGGLGLYSGVGEHLVTDNHIQNNRADLYGGALLIEMPVTLEKNLFENNHARYNYGGISCVDTAKCLVSQNTVSGNYSESYDPALRNPGGLYVKNSTDTTVNNNIFLNNSGYQASVAQFISCSTTVNVFNNTFVDNNTVSGGGATIRTDTDTDLVNNIFKSDIFGIRISGSPVVTINNNNFYGQTIGLITSPSGPITTVSSLNDESYATNNISADPMFVDSSDFHLKRRSPCIDAGTSNGAPDKDIDGDSRPVGGGYDIGADEFIGDLNITPLLKLLLFDN